MTSRKSNPSDVIVHHHDEICDLLSTTNTALRSLAAKLFGEHIIDRRTKNEVTRKTSYKSVDTLLDYLELKIDGNPGLLKKVFDVMEELDALTDVVEKMRMEKSAIQEERQGMPVLTDPSELDKLNPVVEAEKLKQDFEELLVAILVSLAGVDLDDLKLRISWYFNSEQQITPEIQEILDQLQSKTTPQSILSFCITRYFIGYLNFELIKAFQKAVKSEEMKTKIEKYEEKHDAFLHNFSFNAIIEAFKNRPELAPVSVIGLPKFTVRLKSPWEGKSVYAWKEVIERRCTWPPHLIIVSIDKNCIVIKYALLPFFISSVLRDLNDPHVLELLERELVRVDLSEVSLQQMPMNTQEDNRCTSSFVVNKTEAPIVDFSTKRETNKKEFQVLHRNIETDKIEALEEHSKDLVVVHQKRNKKHTTEHIEALKNNEKDEIEMTQELIRLKEGQETSPYNHMEQHETETEYNVEKNKIEFQQQLQERQEKFEKVISHYMIEQDEHQRRELLENIDEIHKRSDKEKNQLVDRMTNEHQKILRELQHQSEKLEQQLTAKLEEQETAISKLKQKLSVSKDTSITPKDFYWDHILVYLVFGFSFLSICVEFFSGSTVHCFTPPQLTGDQISYVENYCYGSLPYSQYYLLFIPTSVLLIILPHYIWKLCFGAHFNLFFDLVKKLDRLRDAKTGEYNPSNFEIVKELEKKFCKSNTMIFLLYKLKLIVQLVISIVVLLANWFYFSSDDFNNTFSCPRDDVNLSTWPLEKSLTCVYKPLDLLWFLHLAAFGLVSTCILFSIIGIVWCLIRHTNELGAKEIAQFCEVSCLPPEEHDFPSTQNVIKQIFLHRKNQNLPSRKEEEYKDDLCSSGCMKAFKQLFHPCIGNDLDFLLMILYFTDSGHGQVFKNIQVYKEIKEKVSKDHELLYLLKRIQSDLKNKRQFQRQEGGNENEEEWERYEDLKKYFFESGLEHAGPGRNPEKALYSSFQVKMGVKLGDWSYSVLRSVLYGFLDFVPNNKFSLHISFDNPKGYSLVLARAFRDVATFHFNKYFQNTKEVFQVKRFQVGYRTITYQDDIFSQEVARITSSEKPITQMFTETVAGRTVDLIVIGPITDKSKIVTASILIEKLHSRKCYFTKDAVLIAIRPLMIGCKSRTEHFVQYKPPDGIFRDINDEVETKLTSSGINMYSVSPSGDVTLVSPSTQSLEDMLPPSSTHLRQRRSTMTSDNERTQKRLGLTEHRQEILPCGVVVQCGDLECVFEFKLYKYCGQTINDTPTLPVCQTPLLQQPLPPSVPSLPMDTAKSSLQSPHLQFPFQPIRSTLSFADNLSNTPTDNKIQDNSTSTPLLVNTQLPTYEQLVNNEERDNYTEIKPTVVMTTKYKNNNC